MQPEKVLVLDPGDERAQKVGKAIGSPLGSEILQSFAHGPMTLKSLSEILQIPMNTAKYHIENLLAADLLEIVNTKYSVKGREVKVYGLKNQVLIVAPKQMDLKSILMRYAAIFSFIIIATVILAILQPLLTLPVPQTPPGQGIPNGEPPLLGNPPPLPQSLYSIVSVVAFFGGSCFVVLLAIGVEYYRRKKRLIASTPDLPAEEKHTEHNSENQTNPEE